MELCDEVRTVFNNAGLAKDTIDLHNLIGYAADWSSWMGWQHTNSNPSHPGQWPHLDELWSHSNIDLVCFDNYLPLSDWTTGTGGIDVLNWSQPAPATWPPGPLAMSGLGLFGTPTIYSKPYLKANIEGGEKFNWFYDDGAHSQLVRCLTGTAQVFEYRLQNCQSHLAGSLPTLGRLVIGSTKTATNTTQISKF